MIGRREKSTVIVYSLLFIHITTLWLNIVKRLMTIEIVLMPADEEAPALLLK